MSSTHPTFGTVLVAAGTGTRAGNAKCSKVYRELAGETVISRAVRAFRAWDPGHPIVIVRHENDAALLAHAIEGADARVYETVGGATRQASVLEGLRFLSSLEQSPSHVLIHDAARPFISSPLLDKIRDAMREEPDIGVILAIPVSDTIKSVDESGLISSTVPRKGLYRAQTPQAFSLPTALKVHEQLADDTNIEYTDDASLFEQAGLSVRVIQGEEKNMKLTYPTDFEQAERILQAKPRLPEVSIPDVRVGHGYDTHRLIPGTQITLCGVKLPHTSGLLGHSDADVGLHAVTNALLGTIGADDIGSHFSPSDPKWKGASSDQFVRHARKLVRDAGGVITHVDVSLICERPRIGPHRDALKTSVARILSLDKSRVSIKAGTNEKVGFVGREEGIVGFATVTAVFPGGVSQAEVNSDYDTTY
ncbi:YgbB family-domain-containing protein [Aspergillus parasiticus]|uniref:2-C-methyl-D-erythritol 4-phosphate cytidylyltransferase, chloroplastic n=1 Tax=Aspergillus parasiticus TaxID=5067 RepID=A0A5N6DC87_ASPPA|nr:YgbB family-domain-containing protein [Aspergillus parasiticus]